MSCRMLWKHYSVELKLLKTHLIHNALEMKENLILPLKAQPLYKFKKKILKIIKVGHSIFTIYNPVRIKLLTRLCMGFSHLNEHKLRHYLTLYIVIYCKLMTAAACNLQRISRMLRNNLYFSYFVIVKFNFDIILVILWVLCVAVVPKLNDALPSFSAKRNQLFKSLCNIKSFITKLETNVSQCFIIWFGHIQKRH